MINKYFIQNTGLINASGKDLIDFINRMSTNDFRKFPGNEFRKTVLTTDKGRIIDLINVLNIPGNQIILTSDNFQEKVKAHLDKYIIMDDVILEKTNVKTYNLIITGSDLNDIAKNIFQTDIVKNKVYKINDEDYLFIADFRFESLNIICSNKNINKYKTLLKDLKEQTQEEYELMRIEAGVPEGENELNDNINPMECGLDKYISFNKGCYIGQEVIARLDSQGKRPKQMVNIESDEVISKDEKIFTDDTESGFISSAVTCEEKNAALGFIRSVNLDFEKKYIVKKREGEIININISKIN